MSEMEKRPLTVIPAQAGIQNPVIPAQAGIFRPLLRTSSSLHDPQ